MKEDDYDHEGCLRTLHQSFLEIQVMSGEVDGASRGGRCVGAWHSLELPLLLPSLLPPPLLLLLGCAWK